MDINTIAEILSCVGAVLGGGGATLGVKSHVKNKQHQKNYDSIIASLQGEIKLIKDNIKSIRIDADKSARGIKELFDVKFDSIEKQLAMILERLGASGKL